MRLLKLIFLKGIFLMGSGTMAADVYTYGYVPKTFPRDPAEVNQFNEHIVLGQIIEPIIDTDRFGNLMPGLATSWNFEDGGRKIVLALRHDRVFSDGRPITSVDAKFTLDRMLEKKSQSGTFIKSIERIEASEPYKLVLFLKNDDVSILKALSRDQLGVMPKDWVYNKDSNEPIIGSGAYRLVKENSNWYLVANQKYEAHEKVTIRKWKLQFYADDKMKIPEGEPPDYMPGAGLMTKSNLKNLLDTNKLKSMEQVSFAQTSAWWHPAGVHFNDEKTKDAVMGIIEDAFESGVKTMGLERATGVIPKGVAGHLDRNVRATFDSHKVTGLKVKIAVVGTIFDDFLKLGVLKDMAKKRDVSLEVLSVSPAELGTLREKKVDMIFACWAGGFNDPEGFVSLLPTLLGKDLKEYIGPKLSEIYSMAKREQNWTKRSELFRDINSALRSSKFMVPGWKDPIFILSRPELSLSEATFRYTPRLESVTVRKM